MLADGVMLKWPDVLIVEDDDSLRFLTSEVFGLEGIAAASVADGCQAMDFFADAVANGGALPRVIILDIMMPCMDGYEVYRHISNTAWIKNTTVIVASAVGEELTIAEHPPHTYILRKPYEVETLLNIVRCAAPDLFPSAASCD
ncbi:MAG: response regulator transcription factor [Anaerolineae bacterium]|nr:response regulator transcription factor [Anaerolineae bacterium]